MSAGQQVTFLDGPLELQRRVIAREYVKRGSFQVPHFNLARLSLPMDGFGDKPPAIPISTYVIEKITRITGDRKKVLYVAYLEIES